MKLHATLSKTATGSEKSKLIDVEYGTSELVFQVQMTAVEFGMFMQKYSGKEFIVEVKDE